MFALDFSFFAYLHSWLNIIFRPYITDYSKRQDSCILSKKRTRARARFFAQIFKQKITRTYTRKTRSIKRTCPSCCPLTTFYILKPPFKRFNHFFCNMIQVWYNWFFHIFPFVFSKLTKILNSCQALFCIVSLFFILGIDKIFHLCFKHIKRRLTWTKLI